MIELVSQRIASGRNACLTAAPAAAGRVQLVLCERLTRVVVPVGLVGVWCPLHGAVWAEARQVRFPIRRGEMYISDPDYAHDINVPIRGSAIAMLASHATWAGIVARDRRDAGILPAMFPAIHDVPVDLRGGMLRLLRAGLRGTGTVSPALAYIEELLTVLQQRMLPALQRCPGASLARRRQIFLRLQRARHLIQTNPARDLHIATLGALTSYSANQLIRLFNRVFGETPYASLLRHRVELARRLIRETDMDICEVSRISGFENRTSFARAFKMHSGATASSFRESLRRVG